MKKIFAIGMTVVMTASILTGCGKASSEYLLDVKYSDYVTLCDYKGVEASKVTFEITEDKIKEQVEQNIYEEVTYDPVTDRGVEMGDYANINYTAVLDDEISIDYSGDDEDIMVGEGFIYPEVEEALIGMKTGDKKTVEVTLTEDFAENEEDVGKKLSLKITLNEITVENIPEYNEEYVKEHTEYSSIEEYEESIKQELLESTEEEYKYVAVEEIMAYIIDNSKFDGYPQELYDSCKENFDSSNEFYASMYGMEVEEYLNMLGLDEAAQEREIINNVNYELVVGAVAQAEGIDCSEQEISDFIKEVYADYGYESEKEFSEDYTEDEVGFELIYEKVMDFLYENAQLKEISEEEYLERENAEMDGMFEGDDESVEYILEDDDADSLEKPEIEIEETDENGNLSIDTDDSSSTEEE